MADGLVIGDNFNTVMSWELLSDIRDRICEQSGIPVHDTIGKEHYGLEVINIPRSTIMKYSSYIGRIFKIKEMGTRKIIFTEHRGNKYSNYFTNMMHYNEFNVYAQFPYSYWVILDRSYYVDGLCTDCVHGCKVDGKEECPFYTKRVR
jgi:hypothetical protein